ncbi:MAG: NPCBM/NEW2 domain-containing protein [Thermoguttaceae bacterium]
MYNAITAAMLATFSAIGSGVGAPLMITGDAIHLSAGPQTWHFTKIGATWALDAIEVQGKEIALPNSRADSFFIGGGEASGFEILAQDRESAAIRFGLGKDSVTYSVDGHSALPLVRVRISGPAIATCGFHSAAADRREHGAWVTRGYVATDAEAHEAFVDASNPLVFGHSRAGALDACYLFIPTVKEHVQRNGRTEQRSDTWFKTERQGFEGDRFSGAWQLRMGRNEPKEFAVLFDCNPGGRLSDVCEKYYAAAVDTLVDVASIPLRYDPQRCMEVMPVRLASPDAFIPGRGWMMDEFGGASYPYAHDCIWQQAAMLAFEGLATGRDWERNFARYLLDKTPLEGKDGQSQFVRRPGGLVRWGYYSTYRDGWPRLDGGTWWTADILYRTAVALNDAALKQAALDMIRHDLNVKLDLDRMSYPPCWNPAENRVSSDHRDDWFQTPGLAYCAYVAAKIAYPETKDARYLEKADRICEWFARFVEPEEKLNDLQGNNMHAVFSHYLTQAFLDKFERSGDRRFLNMARDMAWIHIMTSCTTGAKDSWGNPLTGATCVGVRGCVDYDCSPNLCQEKDQNFVHIIGPLLDHVSGPAYAKYAELQMTTLPKDSWTSAWAADLRDTNLRTMYDTYARGMANLIYALDASSDPRVVAVDTLVSKSDPDITHRRDIAIANGTKQARSTTLQIRFLQPGTYGLSIDGADERRMSYHDLAAGIVIDVAANTMKQVAVRPISIEKPLPTPEIRYDATVTYLSGPAVELLAAQRGTGNPLPTYGADKSIGGHAIRVGNRAFDKGIGCAANTVLAYNLKGGYERFKALVGVDKEVAAAADPPPSVFFTVHVDGMLRFESGPMRKDTAAKEVDVDVRGAHVLMLRTSCNWDDNGNGKNDHGDWAEARLVGRALRY